MILIVINGTVFKTEKEITIGTEDYYVASAFNENRVEKKDSHLIRKDALAPQECCIIKGTPKQSDFFPIDSLMYHVGFITAQMINQTIKKS